MDELSGCPACFGPDADAVAAGRRALAPVVRVVDESHFDVSITRCAACGQRFASIFCESIDWSGGNDPQDSLLVPLAADEADRLAAAGEAGAERVLGELAPARRYLVRSFPSDAAAPAARFVVGCVWVPPHD